MRVAAALALACLVPLVSAAQDATQKKSPGTPKQSTNKTSRSAKSSGKQSAAKGRRKSSKKKSAQSWRTRQSAPTPQRYKEIQEALAKRGYLQGTPTGVWDAQSTEALRRFQQDQSLEPNGKLNSLSLIALGLGAKYPSPAPTSRPPAPQKAAPHNPSAPSTPETGAPAQLPAAPKEENPPQSPAPPPPDAPR